MTDPRRGHRKEQGVTRGTGDHGLATIAFPRRTGAAHVGGRRTGSRDRHSESIAPIAHGRARGGRRLRFNARGCAPESTGIAGK